MNTSATRALVRPTTLDRQIALTVAGSLLIAISAQIAVPLWPVPMTLQTLAVLIVGVALGPRLGAISAALYLLEGAVGLPVFSGFAAGPQHLLGPTAGYLFAFPIAAAIAGYASSRGLCRRPSLALIPMTTATLVILALGALWLSRVGVDALALGVLPFLPGAAIKIALGAMLAPKARQIVQRFLH
jgi:biotin transport system substrate-specific component